MVFTFRQIILPFAALFLIVSCRDRSLQTAEKRNIPVEFHTGDIAFRRGIGVASQAVIMSNYRGSFSHVGIIVEVDNQWMVIHEVPFEGESRGDDKIYCEPVGDFFNTVKATSGAVFRLVGMDSTQRRAVCNYAFRQLTKELPFDHDYDLSDSTRQYCSELVWRSYLEIDIDLSENRRTRVSLPSFAGEHIMPADIELNENLEIIYRF